MTNDFAKAFEEGKNEKAAETAAAEEAKAQAAREKEDNIRLGDEWIASVLAKVAAEANGQLNQTHKIAVVLQRNVAPREYATGKLVIQSLANTQPSQLSVIAFNVLEEGQVNYYVDGGYGARLGHTSDVTAAKIAAVLIDRLRKLGRMKA